LTARPTARDNYVRAPESFIGRSAKDAMPPIFSPIRDLRKASSELWFVTDGVRTIGPVRTELLLRGVLHGRVPSDCMVRAAGWNTWRALDQIREVSVFKRRIARLDAQEFFPLNLREAAQNLPLAVDAGEILLFGLHLAMQATGAHSGAVHRVRLPLLLPITSYIAGVDAECLGNVIPAFDAAYQAAKHERHLFGRVEDGNAQRIVAQRLSGNGNVTSVAMVPLFVHGALHAMLELGRNDHCFRRADADELRAFAVQVAARLEYSPELAI
jgi:hypothetical protein